MAGAFGQGGRSGLVAGIVKLDDAGLHLSKQANAGLRAVGRGLLGFAPWMMKTLSVVGTAAMFMVGGGILTHGVGVLHHFVEGAGEAVNIWPGVGAVFGALLPTLLNAIAGIVAGGLVLLLVSGLKRLRPGRGAH